MLTVNVSFAGLLSPTTVSHIRCMYASGANAIVATAVPTFPGFPLSTTGTYLQTFDLTLASTYNPAFIAAHGGTVAGAQAVYRWIDERADLLEHSHFTVSGRKFAASYSQQFPFPNPLHCFCSPLACWAEP